MSLWQMTLHWAASSYQISDYIRSRYHIIIGADGELWNGIWKPEDNRPIPIPLSLKNGRYAAHCSMNNSWNIGICVLGMAGFTGPHHPGPYPLTRTQCEKLFCVVAETALHYDIPITRQRVRTHWEVGQDDRKAGKRTQNIGKVDITYLPTAPHLTPVQVGDTIRAKARWYHKRLVEEMDLAAVEPTGDDTEFYYS